MHIVVRNTVRLLKRLLGGIVGLLLVLVISGNAYGIYSRSVVRREAPPVGDLISIGTHRMYMHCLGSGSPTVLLEAGGLGFSSDWELVIGPAAEVTRVCAFDRSGLGYSEPGPVAPTPESRSRELEALLTASGETGPYIITGFSLGGELTWLFAQEHLDQMVGLIHVDGVPRDMAELDLLRGPYPGPEQKALLRVVARLGLLPALIRIAGPPETPWILSADGYVDELLSYEQLSQAASTMRDLGDLPLIVITHAHGNPGPIAIPWGDQRDEAEELWQAMQIEMSNLSTNGQLWVAGSSDHLIPWQQPEIVIEAIEALVRDFRASDP